ncbi:hypothetical protein B0H17DRAFT_1147523 [Mycena rosella]|uniref:Uncharacterized protein n=1 Tax=Mycena rosella TaxID=1033263 RepID=A0AAD7CLL1_MYCRO|nr:hypothetical protein B0H17DRAFT_1147523 [Mycena rosella]
MRTAMDLTAERTRSGRPRASSRETVARRRRNDPEATEAEETGSLREKTTEKRTSGAEPVSAVQPSLAWVHLIGSSRREGAAPTAGRGAGNGEREEKGDVVQRRAFQPQHQGVQVALRMQPIDERLMRGRSNKVELSS